MSLLSTFYRRRQIPATEQQLDAYLDLKAFHEVRLISNRGGRLYVTIRACRAGCCGRPDPYRRVVIEHDGTVHDWPHGRGRSR